MKRRKVTKNKNANIKLMFEDMLAKSIRSLKKNSKDIEKAIQQVLSEDDIKASEAEYLEIKSLTDTLNEIDSALNNLGEYDGI